jgi:hypothetical protein
MIANGGGPIGNDRDGVLKPTIDTNGDLTWIGHGDYKTLQCAQDGAFPAWVFYASDGWSAEGTEDLVDARYPWFPTNAAYRGGSYDNGSYSGYHTGVLGCITGSRIQLGGQEFASGAALTSLSFTVNPYIPTVCSATFEIYNKVTGTFPTGASSLTYIDPSEVAHGLFCSYSGITGIDEMSSISYSVTAERAPRYILGKENVHEIKTLSASKEIAFNGWGQSSPILEDPPTSLTFTLGAENNSDVYTDTITGVTIDDSFELPEVGLMSKNFKIRQILV